MTADPTIITEAEELVRRSAVELTQVRPGECLYCYLWRQLDEYSCDGTHRHAVRFRDATAPRATALLARLGRMGACCCDCELFMNGYQPKREFWTRGLDVVQDGTRYVADPEPPDVLPPCAGVRRGSITPCANWVSVRRSWQ